MASAALSAGLRRIHQWIPFAVATPLQAAVSLVLRPKSRDYYGRLRRMYQAKRDRLVTILREAGLEPLVPEGTYFVVADTAALGWGADDVAFCRRLTSETRSPPSPPAPFTAPPTATWPETWRASAFARRTRPWTRRGPGSAGCRGDRRVRVCD